MKESYKEEIVNEILTGIYSPTGRRMRHKGQIAIDGMMDFKSKLTRVSNFRK